ncbi:hypothetical protein B0O99DRAFT_559719 [Bisporella sp. PMI_857]|nr:hypothetical protein B0O99DRAFT_559719 [Bisporella sp. PMI_857]
MASAWINLSTRWSLSSVQATLNVIISILGTISIWTFSRFWWQRAGSKVVRDKSDVPLPALYTIVALGDGWDILAVLGRQLLHRESWHLLFQLIFVVVITLITMFSGPIAALTSRTCRTIQKTTLDVLQTVKIAGSSANLLEAIVLWNQTIISLNQALFPNDQLLDYLPPSTVNWTFVASEWDPTWTMKCNYTNEVLLHNVSANGNSTFYDPINAFPVYRDTYDQKWLNASEYRYQADFVGWTAGIGVNAPFTDILLFTMIESDPAIDDRWGSNNDTMELSISALHLQNVSGLNDQWFNLQDQQTWRPTGQVANASYTRFECSIARKPEVPDENLIPWVWTNDTYSITSQYRAMWGFPFGLMEGVNITYPTPSAQELLRFYQAYMVTLGTTYDVTPSPMKISVWMETVQLSIVFLAIIILSSTLVIGLSIRYFVFLGRHKSKLSEMFVPDGKMEWMVYAAKASAAASDAEVEITEGETTKNGAYFHAATFGYSDLKPDGPVGNIRYPSLARVHTRKCSISGPLSRTKNQIPITTSIRPIQAPPIAFSQPAEMQSDLEKQPPAAAANTSSGDQYQRSVPRDHSSPSNMTTLNPQVSRKSSTKETQALCSCDITLRDDFSSRAMALDDGIPLSVPAKSHNFPIVSQ